MAGRQAKRNIGGGTWYTAGSSKVAKEAEEKKRGGRHRKSGGRTVGAHGGMLTGGRLDKRARGGKIQQFAHGGRTGSDKSPFTSAAEAGDTGRTSHTSPPLGRRG